MVEKQEGFKPWHEPHRSCLLQTEKSNEGRRSLPLYLISGGYLLSEQRRMTGRTACLGMVNRSA